LTVAHRGRTLEALAPRLVHYAVLASLVGALVAAAPAAAVPRYVEPGGATSGSECTPPSPQDFFEPCDLEYAVEGVSKDGDEVIVAPGTYTGDVAEADNVLIHGVAGAERPLIVGDLSLTDPQGGAARYLEIHGAFSLGGAGRQIRRRTSGNS